MHIFVTFLKGKVNVTYNETSSQLNQSINLKINVILQSDDRSDEEKDDVVGDLEEFRDDGDSIPKASTNPSVTIQPSNEEKKLLDLDIMPNLSSLVEPTKAQRLEYTSSSSFRRKRPRRPGGGGSRSRPTTPTPTRRPGSRPPTPPTPATETDFLYDSGIKKVLGTRRQTKMQLLKFDYGFH